jgi:hypothetical protein
MNFVQPIKAVLAALTNLPLTLGGKRKRLRTKRECTAAFDRVTHGPLHESANQSAALSLIRAIAARKDLPKMMGSMEFALTVSKGGQRAHRLLDLPSANPSLVEPSEESVKVVALIPLDMAISSAAWAKKPRKNLFVKSTVKRAAS